MKQSEYYAFISYNGADEDKAKWLQEKLEYYHIPAQLCKDYPSLPKKIRPVFLDKTDISGTELKKSLNKELYSSRFLIVICSPEAVKSYWVNDEIRSFIEQGKRKYIIPLIVRGKPHSENKEEECLPPDLLKLEKENEIRAIDLNRKEGKEHALVDVIATMFGVRFDTLWQRHKRRKRKIQAIWFSSICALLVLLFGLYVHMRPTYQYYADITACEGKPQGITEISEEDVKNRYVSYKFVYKREHLFARTRTLNRVERVNSYDSPTNYFPAIDLVIEGELKNEYPIIELTESGLIFYDEHENFMERWELSRKKTFDENLLIYDIHRGAFNRGPDDDFAAFSERQQKTAVNRYCYALDKNGYCTKITYHSSSSNNLFESNCDNSRGAYGYLLKRDSLGRKVELEGIDAEGKKDIDRFNLNKIEYQYSEWGVESMRCYGLHNDPILAEAIGWVHKQEAVFDEYGNVIVFRSLGLDNEPMNNKYGYATQKAVYKNGCLIEGAFFDHNGHRTLENTSMSSRFTQTYDSEGRLVKSVFYDANDNLYPNSDGAAIVEYTYDSDGRPSGRSYYDINKKPTISKLTGYATLKQKVNEQGQVIEATCLGIHGEKILNKEGYCSSKIEYSNPGAPSYQEFYDTLGNLTENKSGYAISKIEYTNDRAGNTIISTALFGKNREPVIDKQSLSHKFVITINELGQVIEASHFDTNDNRTICASGFSKYVIKYDKKGRLSSRSFLDTNDSLTLLYFKDIAPSNNQPFVNTYQFGGYAKDSIVYLSKHKELKYYINELGQIDGGIFYPPIEMRELRGDTLITINYDKDFKKVKGVYGYSICISLLDKFKRPIDACYFDEDSVRCNDKSFGLSRYKNKYDARGNMIEVSYYDQSDNLVNYGVHGAIIKMEFDERNNLIKKEFYNESKLPYTTTIDGHILEFKYNNKDQMISKTSYDAQKQPYCSPQFGFSSVRYKYDTAGNMIEESYYNDFTPVNNVYGYHMVKHIYDEHNLPIETWCLNKERQKVMVMGNHKLKTIYDGYKLVAHEYYNENDRLIGTRKHHYDRFYNIDYQTNIDSLNNSFRTYPRLVLKEKTDNNNEKVYVIAKWEDWDISQPINNYIQTLMRFKEYITNKVYVYNVFENKFEWKFIDGNSFIETNPVPENYYLLIKENLTSTKPKS